MNIFGNKKNKVMIWGVGSEMAMWLTWLGKRTEIVAYICDSSKSTKHTYRGRPIIAPANVNGYVFEYILVPNGYVDIVRDQLNSFDGNDCEKIIVISDFISNILGVPDANEVYHQDIVEAQQEILKRFIKATDREMASREWLLAVVKEFGIFCYINNYLDWDDDINWNFYGLLQMPEEFAGFLGTLNTLSIANAIEIGVAAGRSSYLMSAVLYRNNKKLSYDMVDILDNLDHFDEYKAILPCLNKRIPTTSDDYIGKEYDFVFIDADHSYDASIKDYENVGRFARKIVAFHDVYAHEYNWDNGGTVRLWEEVQYRTQGKEHRIFSKYPRRWMGIGAVIF